jgi:NADPH2:quinone reductase
MQIRSAESGGRLEMAKVELPPLADDEVRIQLRRIGVNFSEINFRWARYGFVPRVFPYTPGIEGVGVIETLGASVGDFAAGDRVCMAAGGANQMYADVVQVKADTLIPIPDDIDDETCAAIALKGLMARSMVVDAFPLKRGDIALVHGATGGTGHLLCQWAKHLGATVIGTVGNAAKVAAACEFGCDAVLVRGERPLAEAVREATDGNGVAVVYDPLGQEALAASLAALRRRGTLVSYGNTSGPIAAIDPALLMTGSLYVTRPMLHDYVTNATERRQVARELFALVRSGTIKPAIDAIIPLSRVADAHDEIEGRRTTGSVVLSV